MTAKVKAPTLVDRSNTPEPPETAGPERDLCVRCGLWRTARTPFMNPPPPKNYTGEVLVLGEAPGGDEDDRSKRFFSGKSGRMLRQELGTAGLRVALDPVRDDGAAQDVDVWNTVRCRPPNNAAPTMEQIRCCRPYVLNRILTVKPRKVQGLGASAARCLTNDGGASVVKTRGRTLEIPGLPQEEPNE